MILPPVAAPQGNSQTVSALMRAGADVDAVGADGRTMLHAAATAGARGAVVIDGRLEARPPPPVPHAPSPSPPILIDPSLADLPKPC